MKNNHTYTFNVPSNLKAGKYVVRHEIISLHFALRGSADAPGTPLNGAEVYPVCFNVDVINEDGGVAAPTVGTFPGIYRRSDPGILTNIYYGPNRYVCAEFSYIQYCCCRCMAEIRFLARTRTSCMGRS